MPGLVNAHTHLELSMLKGVIPDGLDFADWVYLAITKRGEYAPKQVDKACADAVRSLIDTGTVAVGDIANGGTTSLAPLVDSPLYAVIFNEATGFQTQAADARFKEFTGRIHRFAGGRVVQSIAPHAAYSVSPRLLSMIGTYLEETRFVSTVHLAESLDEMNFLKNGGGKMRAMIEKLGRWDTSWHTPGTSPVQYLDAFGLWQPKMLAVHAVHTDDEDIRILKERGVSVCTCPRSNVKINVGGVAPIRRFLDAGIPVCIGTDSLASNDDLNLWNEMVFLAKQHPDLTPNEILTMATLQGARALGFDESIGSIEAGKQDALIAVTFKKTVNDPEAALLSGFDKFLSIQRLHVL